MRQFIKLYTNRLVRQYSPQKTSLRGFDQNFLDEVADKLNTHPRRILTFLPPSDIINHSVALTP